MMVVQGRLLALKILVFFFPIYLRILLGFIPKIKRYRLYPKVGNKIIVQTV